ncbi:PTS sugar transporter subunit IIA [Enterobacter sp. CC120223-11]|uniref:PTS sugar transporter subunit IIA n=1 Tax=Enterobacter sp. CC120223-11 TaxID=1378073 RepID=UPI000BDBA95D|nr:PTS sugar transporter subunit IIA [Enterobacter sp. CC120223-11]SNY66642.1 PTS system, galactitol-specific IIA component [Enterobacter sp. CC120223-11]
MQDIYFRRHFVQHLPQGLTPEGLIPLLAAPLIADGMVVEAFAQHVIAREATFPTGLAVEPIGVAIPHTDHKYVHRNAISVGILSEPVMFEDMGGEPEPVPVRVIFMLALGESNKQLNVLGWIMDLIQDADFMQQLLTMEDEEIYQSILARMAERGEL